MQTDIEKSVYMFVHNSFYKHKYDLSKIVKNMHNFYCNRLNSEMIDYAVSLYCMFSDHVSESSDSLDVVDPEQEFEQLKF